MRAWVTAIRWKVQFSWRLPRRSRRWRCRAPEEAGSGVASKPGVALKASRPGDLGDQLGRGERAAARQLEQLRGLLANAPSKLALERVDIAPERRAAAHQLPRQPHPHALLAPGEPRPE